MLATASQELVQGYKSTTEFDDDLDCIVEVTGVGAGLQTAIDRVGDGGKVVVGSLFGKGDVKLKLGLDFHRSKKTLVSSQVSEIPAALSHRWTKGRGFEAAWEEIRRARLGRVLAGNIMGMKDVQKAFEALDKGDVAIIAIDLKKRAGVHIRTL